MEETYGEYIPLLKAIADETRLKIVDMLSCGELCANDILEKLNISQSTLSYHMKLLTETNLIYGRREGAWMRYTINPKKSEELIGFLKRITMNKDQCICKK